VNVIDRWMYKTNGQLKFEFPISSVGQSDTRKEALGIFAKFADRKKRERTQKFIKF
jgi:hypothetical protein